MRNFLRNIDISGYIYFILAIILIVGSISLSGSDVENTTHILKAHGYTNIKCDGYAWTTGDRELNRTKFTATSPNGESVTGAICYSFRPSNADIIIKGN